MRGKQTEVFQGLGRLFGHGLAIGLISIARALLARASHSPRRLKLRRSSSRCLEGTPPARPGTGRRVDDGLLIELALARENFRTLSRSHEKTPRNTVGLRREWAQLEDFRTFVAEFRIALAAR